MRTEIHLPKEIPKQILNLSCFLLFSFVDHWSSAWASQEIFLGVEHWNWHGQSLPLQRPNINSSHSIFSKVSLVVLVLTKKCDLLNYQLLIYQKQQLATLLEFVRIELLFLGIFVCASNYFYNTFHLGIWWIRWHAYVTEQVIKNVNQIKQVNNLQRIIRSSTKPS